jgi:hypothetical protein
MSKRLFEILDEMNLLDDDKRGRVIVCPDMIRADWNKKGTVFQMGAGGGMDTLLDVEAGKKFPILLIIDKDEYKRIRDEN